jgi:hypothetical protein
MAATDLSGGVSCGDPDPGSTFAGFFLNPGATAPSLIGTALTDDGLLVLSLRPDPVPDDPALGAGGRGGGGGGGGGPPALGESASRSSGALEMT